MVIYRQTPSDASRFLLGLCRRSLLRPAQLVTLHSPLPDACPHPDNAEDAGRLGLCGDAPVRVRHQNDAELMMVPGIDRALQILALSFAVLHLQLAERGVHAQRLMQLRRAGQQDPVDLQQDLAGQDAQLLRGAALQHGQHLAAGGDARMQG